jgi:acetylornithine deacetylase/succinyl-diaminopimelate desuccinylase-like protein
MPPPHVRMAVVGYPDEEWGSVVFSEIFKRGFSTDVALQMDGAPVPEGGSNVSFVKSSKLAARFNLELVDGPLLAAHSARPHLAPSALEDHAVPFIQQIRQPIEEGGAGIPRTTDEEPINTTAIIKVVRSDAVPNATNSDIGLYMELRSLNEKKLKEDLARVETVAQANGLQVLPPFYQSEALTQGPNTPEVVLYRDIGKEVMGKNMDIRRDTGGNDLAKIPPHPRTVRILSGFRGGGSHGPHEHVLLDAIQDATKIQTVLVGELPYLPERK